MLDTTRPSPAAISARAERVAALTDLAPALAARVLAVADEAAALDPTGLLGDHRHHAVRVATAARLLAPTVGVRPSDAFAAGLLHDVGELLLLDAHPGAYLALHRAAATHVELLRTEKARFGTDHALAGAEHLLDQRIPDVIADAVADHHDPFHTSAGTTIVVAAADELISAEAGRTHALDLLELDVAAAQGLLGRVDDEAAEVLGLLAATP
ncbi:MAG: HDOD domain-containing protein [Acidimicrobiia bacterium]